jgi:hypothetical protein
MPRILTLRSAIAPLLGICLLATSARAHELVPASWCHGGTRQLLLEVHFSQDRLQGYKNTHVAVDLVTGQPCPQHAKCGIVDDWHWATQMMNEALPPAAGQRSRTSAAGAVIARVLTADYNHADHHEAYRFDDGLHVQYLECRFTVQNSN